MSNGNYLFRKSSEFTITAHVHSKIFVFFRNCWAHEDICLRKCRCRLMFHGCTSSNEHSTSKAILRLYCQSSNLSMLMIPASSSKAPACIIRAGDDEPYMLKGQGHTTEQQNTLRIDSIVKTDWYSPLERCKEKEHEHRVVKSIDERNGTDW